MTSKEYENKDNPAPPGGDNYHLNGTLSEGSVAVLGPDANVTIQQHFSGLSPQKTYITGGATATIGGPSRR
jgi:hypothetical protein